MKQHRQVAEGKHATARKERRRKPYEPPAWEVEEAETEAALTCDKANAGGPQDDCTPTMVRS